MLKKSVLQLHIFSTFDRDAADVAFHKALFREQIAKVGNGRLPKEIGKGRPTRAARILGEVIFRQGSGGLLPSRFESGF